MGKEEKKVVKETPKSTTGIVNTSVLNLRAKPSFDSEVIAFLMRGLSVTIIKDSRAERNGWLKVKTRDGDGYVFGKFIDGD